MSADTVVHIYHQHGPISPTGRFEEWNPPVGLGMLEDEVMMPEWVEDKLITAVDTRPEFATPPGHWSRWRVIPRDTAPRERDLQGRFPGIRVDLADHPNILTELRSYMQVAELYFRDTSDQEVPTLYTVALGWLADGESDPVMWERMVRHAVACGVTQPRIARELGVELARVYEVVADPWRDDHLAKAEHFRQAGMTESAEREEAKARARELAMEP